MIGMSLRSAAGPAGNTGSPMLPGCAAGGSASAPSPPRLARPWIRAPPR